MMKPEDEIKAFAKEIRSKINNSQLAALLDKAVAQINRQRNELIALHKENDALRYRLVRAQQGLQDAKAAIISLTETRNGTQD